MSDHIANLRKRFKDVSHFPQHDPEGWNKMLLLRKAVEEFLADHPEPSLAQRLGKAIRDMDDRGIERAIREVEELEARMEGLET